MKKQIVFSLILVTLLIVQCKSTFDSEKASVLILGTWAEKEDENADFVISEKKIEYFDTGYLYNYSINNDKDLIILDSNQIVLKFRIIKLSIDSLIIQSKNEGNKDIVYKYCRR